LIYGFGVLRFGFFRWFSLCPFRLVWAFVCTVISSPTIGFSLGSLLLLIFTNTRPPQSSGVFSLDQGVPGTPNSVFFLFFFSLPISVLSIDFVVWDALGIYDVVMFYSFFSRFFSYPSLSYNTSFFFFHWVVFGTYRDCITFIRLVFRWTFLLSFLLLLVL